jgi:hypothetical protein
MVCKSAASGVVRAVRWGHMTRNPASFVVIRQPAPRTVRPSTPAEIDALVELRPDVSPHTNERAASAATTSSRDLTGTTGTRRDTRVIPRLKRARGRARGSAQGEKPALDPDGQFRG